MKKNKQILFILLSVLIFTSSCETEKRLYMPGFYSQWHSKKTNNENPIAENLNKEKSVNIVTKEVPISVDDNQNSINNDCAILASNDNSPVILSHASASIKRVEVENKSIKNPSNNLVLDKGKSSSISKIKKINKNKSSESDSSSGGGTKALGFVFLLSGFVVLLFVSILLGLLIMVPGIIFLATGKKRNKSQDSNNKSKENSEFVDVLYLKNGSVLRGMIVEQTPGVSIKIQTKDGNVFVYKMDEVEKMTKEVSK